MQNRLYAISVFTISSLIVLFVDVDNLLPLIAPKVLSLLFILCIVLLNAFFFSLIRMSMLKKIKWLVLFLATFLIQLLVLASGGLFGPFLVLMYLFVIGIGIFFSFEIALYFLASSLVLLAVNILVHPLNFQLFISDIGSDLIYIASFITIIPLIQIITHRYHLRETLFNSLTNQVKVEQAILANIDEMLFVVGRDLTILSINETVEKTYKKSKSEIIEHPFFDLVFLRDNGALMTPETMGIKQMFTENKQYAFDNLLLIIPSIVTRRVRIIMKPILNQEGDVDQLSIVISDVGKGMASSEALDKMQLDVAQAHYEASLEDLRKKLFEQGMSPYALQLFLAIKTSQDVKNLRTIEDYGLREDKVVVDVSKICAKLVSAEQNYAKLFGRELQFDILNFGTDDIPSFARNNKQVDLRVFTDPVFSAAIDVKYVSLILEKLLDIAVLVSSSSTRLPVLLTIERQSGRFLFIKVATSIDDRLDKASAQHIFDPYYPGFSVTNLALGSGLEGTLARNIAQHLALPLEVDINESSHLVFSLVIDREPKKEKK